MLVQFCVENFRSFKERAVFSMVGYGERIHRHHLIRAKNRQDVNLQRVAAIYGANASGKSNFARALAYMQDLIINGRRPSEGLSQNPFKLDPEWLVKPSVFQADFKKNGQLYSYGFKMTDRTILEEWLLKTTPYSEKILFRREKGHDRKVMLSFGPFLKSCSEEERNFLKFVSMGTRENQLFLTEAKERNVHFFSPAYDWFLENLRVIGPHSSVAGLEIMLQDNREFSKFMASVLAAADTGITKIKTQKISLESLQLPIEVEDKLKKMLGPQEMVFLQNSGQRLCISRNTKSGYAVYKLLAVHGGPANETSFELEEESDGTLRLIDLVPALYELQHDEEMVYFIDEIGRSLHPKMLELFLDIHLGGERTQRTNQLIFTTHHTDLLTLKRFRRGEIWFVEKNPDGATEMFSLLDFKTKARFDKDIRKAYLAGRFGGMPRVKDWPHEARHAL